MLTRIAFMTEISEGICTLEFGDVDLALSARNKEILMMVLTLSFGMKAHKTIFTHWIATVNTIRSSELATLDAVDLSVDVGFDIVAFHCVLVDTFKLTTNLLLSSL